MLKLKTSFVFFFTTFFSVFLAHSQGKNLIKNSGFENDYYNWEFFTLKNSKAFFRNETSEVHQGSKSLKVDVQQLGKDPWDVSMLQPFKSQKGYTYEIKFHAKASKTGKSIRMQLQKTTYEGKEFFLSTSWEEYTHVLGAKENGLALGFHFLEKGLYYIDNIKVKRIKNKARKAKAQISDDNSYDKKSPYLQNGDFEGGFEGWVNLSGGGGKAIYKLNRKTAYQGRLSMKVNVLKKGENPWDIQSVKGLNLKKNKRYRLKFNAKSLGAKVVTLQMQDLEEGIFLTRKFNAGFDWQQYSWDFDAESSNMKLVIHHTKGVVEFDNFEIELAR